MIIHENIQDCFDTANIIHVIIDNNEEWYDNNDYEYKEIIFYLKNMLKGSHQMPALSVSLDNETRIAMKTGVWLEFLFDIEGINNDLPFSSLLIEVNENSGGFNIIRKYKDKYDGRCFYIDLNNKNMSELYNYLIGK